MNDPVDLNDVAALRARIAALRDKVYGLVTLVCDNPGCRTTLSAFYLHPTGAERSAAARDVATAAGWDISDSGDICPDCSGDQKGTVT